MSISVSYVAVKKAVEKVVLDVKTKVITEFDAYVKEHVDEESYESMKELFTGFQTQLTNMSVKLDDEVASAKTTKKGKRGAGPAKEKKALSPYNIFIKETIEALKKSNPDMKGQELMKKATEAWKARKADSA